MSASISIQFLNGPRTTEKIRLDQLPVHFGRTTESTVVLDWDGLISGKHFEILEDEGFFFLRDSGSRNGTKVNSVPVVRQRLYDGDFVEVGSTKLQVLISANSPIPTPHRSPDRSDSGKTPSDSVDPPKWLNPILSSSIEFVGVESTPHSSPLGDSLRDGRLKETSVSEPFDRQEPQLPDEVLPSEKGELQPAAIIEQVRLRVEDDSIGSATLGGPKKLYWLAPGQAMTFGRSLRCDCCIESDPYLSSIHFKLSCDTEHCMVEDMSSSSGTWLNGVQVAEAELFHGDRLVAGKIEFRVEVEGNRGPILRPGKSEAFKRKVVAPLEVQLNPGQSLDLTRQKCASGLTTIKGFDSELLSMDVFAELIRPLGTLFLLIDLSRCSLPFPEGIDPQSGQLFQWLPSQLAASSPQLVSLDELPDWQAYVNDGIGNDALVILQSALQKSDLLDLLRKCLGGNPSGSKPFRGILGFCWPSVMAAALENQPSDFPEQLFSGVSMVTSETQNGKSYQVFSKEPERMDTVLSILDRRKVQYSINREQNLQEPIDKDRSKPDSR